MGKETKKVFSISLKPPIQTIYFFSLAPPLVQDWEFILISLTWSSTFAVIFNQSIPELCMSSVFSRFCWIWNLLPPPLSHGILYSVFCILSPQSPSHHSNLPSHEYPPWFHSHSAGGLCFVLASGWNFFHDFWYFPSSSPYFCTKIIPETPPQVICWQCQGCLFSKPFLPPPLFIFSRNVLLSFCHFSFSSLFVPFLPPFCSSQKLLLKTARLPNPSAFKDKLIWSYLGRA